MKNNPIQAVKDLGADDQAIEKLQQYAALMTKWNKAINLVAPSTLDDIWGRHILDSAQLWPVIQQHICNACEREHPQIDPRLRKGCEEKSSIIDLGSGGGLPGIVLAVMGVEHITMIESDTRKCIFLQEVTRELGLKNVTIIQERIEKPREIKANIVTARALAPLKTLVEWASPHLLPDGIMVFPKGESWATEVADLDDAFHVEQYPSMTDKAARIVVLSRP